MKNYVKNMLGILGCIVFLQISQGSIVFAKENTVTSSNVSKSVVSSTSNTQKDANELKNSNDLPSNITANVLVNTASTEDVATNKSWKVKFNQPIDPDSLKGKIKIVNKSSGEEVSSYLSLEENSTVVVITPNCDPGTNYSLVIDKDIKSKNNKELQDSVSIDFKTSSKVDTNQTASTDDKADTVINFTENVNLTAKANEKVTLPSTIDGTTASGKTVQVNVTWDQPVIYADETGVFTYYGVVQGFSKKVCLKLTITPAEDENNKEVESHSELQKNLYNYLMASEDNRQSVMNRAVELHGGVQSNNCVYFASEALRRAGLTDLAESVCNTITLTNELLSRGWTKSDNLDELKSGDICFTISYGNGPTHTYTFMNWINPDDHGYAYICDNQGDEYEGDPYHKRNINFSTPTKDQLSYFMYKP